jgi:capsular polysaccharide biosynthesis protein
MKNEEIEITLDVRDIIRILKKRFWLIFSITLIAALISGLYSVYVLKPIYQSKVSIVIGKLQDATEQSQYNYNDVMMFQNLMKTYAQIANSRTVAQKALELLGSKDNMTVKEIMSQTTVTPQADTQIIELSVKNGSPELSKAVLDAVCQSFTEEATRIFPSGYLQIIDTSEVPKIPVGPRKKLNVAIAFLLGLMASLGLSFMLEYLDNTIKNESDLERYIGIPVIGVIPKKSNNKHILT